MEEKFNIDEYIKIDGLTKISEQLEKVGEYIDSELSNVNSLECTEENKQEVKKVRTNINNVLKQFEEKRKFIKNEVLKDYSKFEDKYKIEVKEKLENASTQLSEKIGYIENQQILDKKNEICEFIEEHIKSRNLEDIIDIDNVIEYGNLKINLSTSIKSLKDDALEFLDILSANIILIESDEYSEEVLLEFKKNGYVYSNAKISVIERHKEIERLKEKQEQVQKIKEQEQKIEEKVEKEIEISIPKPIIDDEEILECTFKVITTKSNLKLIKEYLNNLGIEYE